MPNHIYFSKCASNIMCKLRAWKSPTQPRWLREGKKKNVERHLLTDTSFDSKEIKPVNLKGNQHQIIIGRTDAEAEVPVFWSSAVNSRLIGKVPDAGKDWGQKEKKASEDEMTGWLHQCNGHELGQTWGDGEGQGSMVYCSPWGCKESDMTRQLNNN